MAQYEWDRYIGHGSVDGVDAGRWGHPRHQQSRVPDFSHWGGGSLLFGNSAATASQFQLNFASTPGAGAANIEEVFVVYKPTS